MSFPPIGDPLLVEALRGTMTRTAVVTATQAQINAGLVAIPGEAGRKIRVTNFVARVTGNFATGTSVDLQSSAGSPVKVVVLATANLTNGNVLVPTATGVTLGAGYGADLGAGESLNIARVGSTFTGGTSITFTITFTTVR